MESESSPAVGIAIFLATLQILAAGITGIVMLLYLSTSGLDYGTLMGVGVAAFETAVAVAFLCRVDTARVFLAGQYAILGLVSVALVIIGVAVRGPALGFAALVPLLVSIAGALSFVSIAVRRRCAGP